MKIIEKSILAEALGVRISKLVVKAPLIAQKAAAGQFVAIMVSEAGERVPLTVVEKNVVSGTVTLIVQELGLTTRLLGRLKAGDCLYSIVGPLGHATEIKNYQGVILVGGGVGIAEIYPVAKALKEAENQITTILGARTKDLLILEAELKKLSDNFYVTTDDASCGRQGFVTEVLKELLTAKEAGQVNYGLIYAVGPLPMMKNVALASKGLKVKTLVSLNSLMVDATGMCGCCRVTVGGKAKFSCVDGPEFDAGQVDWDELAKRNQVYQEKEKHICQLNKLS